MSSVSALPLSPSLTSASSASSASASASATPLQPYLLLSFTSSTCSSFPFGRAWSSLFDACNMVVLRREDIEATSLKRKNAGNEVKKKDMDMNELFAEQLKDVIHNSLDAHRQKHDEQYGVKSKGKKTSSSKDSARKNDGKSARKSQKVEEEETVVIPPCPTLNILLYDVITSSVDLHHLSSFGIDVSAILLFESPAANDSALNVTDAERKEFLYGNPSDLSIEQQKLMAQKNVNYVIPKIHMYDITDGVSTSNMTLESNNAFIQSLTPFLNNTIILPCPLPRLQNEEIASPVNTSRKKPEDKKKKEKAPAFAEADLPLVERYSHELLLHIEDFATSRHEYLTWHTAPVVSVAVSSGSVSTQLYTHLLSSIDTPNAEHCLIAMIEQVGSATQAHSHIEHTQFENLQKFMQNKLQQLQLHQSTAEQQRGGNCSACLGGSHSSPSATCSQCGQAPSNIITYNDAYALQRAPSPLQLAAEYAMRYLHLPGYERCGFPPQAFDLPKEMGEETSRMVFALQHNPKLSPAVYIRALLLLELEEMSLHPSFPWSLSSTSALTSGVQQQAVQYISALTGQPVLGSEVKHGISRVHTDYLKQESDLIEKNIEQAIEQVSKKYSSVLGWDSNHAVAKLSLEEREYIEELNARALPQALRSAMYSPSNTLYSQARYLPSTDQLLVLIHHPLPYTRRDERHWSAIMTPNFNLQQYMRIHSVVQKSRPSKLFSFSDPNFTGKLSILSRVFYPCDQGRMGLNIYQSGEHTSALAWVEKDDVYCTLEKQSTLVPSAPIKVEVVATPEPITVVDKAEEEELISARSRPISRGEKKEKDEKKRQGSAGKERKKPEVKVLNLEKEKKTGDLTKRGTTSTKSTAKGKSKDKEAEELLAAASVEVAAPPPVVIPPPTLYTSFVFAANFSDGSRLSVQGLYEEQSQRVGWTSRDGLVTEIRQNHSVYLSFPKSSLDGGLAHTAVLVPVNKQAGKSDSTADNQSTTTGSEQENAAASPSAPNAYQAAASLPISPFPSNAGVLSTAEQWRILDANGTVYKSLCDGSFTLLLANGTVAHKRSEQDSWVWTELNGARWKYSNNERVHLESLQTVQQYDAESGAVVTTRADLSMFILYANGSSLAQHNDGTRIYVDLKGDEKTITIEHPSFPPTVYQHSILTQLREGDSSLNISAGLEKKQVIDISINSNDGTKLRKKSGTDSIVVERLDGAHFITHPNNSVLYLPATFNFSSLQPEFLNGVIDFEHLPRHIYTFSLTVASGGSIQFLDAEDSVYRVSAIGLGEMVLGRDRLLEENKEDSIPPQYYPPPSNPIPPRVFVIRGDGTGYELLDHEAVNSFLNIVSKQANTVSLPGETLYANDREQNACVSLKYVSTIKRPQNYVRHPVIPNVVRSAPSSLAAGSSLAVLSSTDPLLTSNSVGPNGPLYLYRHLIHVPPITTADKQKVAQAKAAYRDWKEQQVRLELDYKLAEDDRTDDEKAEELRLQQAVLNAREQLQVENGKHQDAIQVQQSHVADQVSNPSSEFHASTTTAHRPVSANAHRLPSSSTLLPAPFHSDEEAVSTLQNMVQTLQRPPQNFFHNKKTGRDAPKKEKTSNNSNSPFHQPLSATTEFPPFFNHPTFRSAFLLSSLYIALQNSCCPSIVDSSNEDDVREQSAEEREDSWQHLTEAQQNTYLQTYQTALSSKIHTLYASLSQTAQLLNQPLTLSRNVDIEDSIAKTWRGDDELRGMLNTVLKAAGLDYDDNQWKLRVSPQQFQQNVDEIKTEFDNMLNQPITADSRPWHVVPLSQTTSSSTVLSPPASSQPPAVIDQFDYDATVSALSAQEKAAYEATPEYQAKLIREQRLRAIPATTSTQSHASHGQSFVYRSPFSPNPPHYPPHPERTYIPPTQSTVVDVTGAPRISQVSVPTALGDSAEFSLNENHLMSELQSGQSRPAVKTASTVKHTWHDPTSTFASFILQPSAVDFGILRKGCTYRATLSLTNKGHISGRFQVIQPEHSSDSLMHVEVLYRPGLIAPGLQRRMEVQLYAGEVCQYRNQVIVKTEQQVFRLPIAAHIMNDSDYYRHHAAAGADGAKWLLPASVDPTLNMAFDSAYPSHPSKRLAGPFSLESTFKQTAKPFAKAGTIPPPLASSANLPGARFGVTGEMRIVADHATPYVQHALERTYAYNNHHDEKQDDHAYDDEGAYSNTLSEENEMEAELQQLRIQEQNKSLRPESASRRGVKLQPLSSEPRI